MGALSALLAGRAREDVAAIFGVSLKAVDKWWAKWQACGREALVMRPRGKPVGVHPGVRGSGAGRRAAGGLGPPALGRPGPRSARRRRPTAGRSCSPTTSASAPTGSPAALGARRARHPWSGGAGTSSPYCPPLLRQPTRPLHPR
ncbi:helix-turn-helix domain-containing protein [Streptomyces sp. P5-A9]|uniref:helix-turn-helix domain-containing protein n=1 Tax=Streptomyces sp. P5-A9 TaxID=3071730 RepID=UPI003FCD9B5E